MDEQDVIGPNSAHIEASRFTVTAKKHNITLPHAVAANIAVWILFKICPEALTERVRKGLQEYDRAAG